MKTISDRIFEKLKEKGMSQKEFSQKTGIAESSISDWKKKHTNPVSDKILIICEVLDISPYELLSGAEHIGTRSRDNQTYVFAKDTDVFCKPFLHKIAKSFCRLLHLHFVGNCKTTAGSYSASHKPLQIIFSCYNTRYGNGSSEFSSSCACSLK